MLDSDRRTGIVHAVDESPRPAALKLPQVRRGAVELLQKWWSGRAGTGWKDVSHELTDAYLLGARAPLEFLEKGVSVGNYPVTLLLVRHSSTVVNRRSRFRSMCSLVAGEWSISAVPLHESIRAAISPGVASERIAAYSSPVKSRRWTGESQPAQPRSSGNSSSAQNDAADSVSLAATATDLPLQPLRETGVQSVKVLAHRQYRHTDGPAHGRPASPLTPSP